MYTVCFGMRGSVPRISAGRQHTPTPTESRIACAGATFKPNARLKAGAEVRNFPTHVWVAHTPHAPQVRLPFPASHGAVAEVLEMSAQVHS